MWIIFFWKKIMGNKTNTHLFWWWWWCFEWWWWCDFDLWWWGCLCLPSLWSWLSLLSPVVPAPPAAEPTLSIKPEVRSRRLEVFSDKDFDLCLWWWWPFDSFLSTELPPTPSKSTFPLLFVLKVVLLDASLMIAAASPLLLSARSDWAVNMLMRVSRLSPWPSLRDDEEELLTMP